MKTVRIGHFFNFALFMHFFALFDNAQYFLAHVWALFGFNFAHFHQNYLATLPGALDAIQHCGKKDMPYMKSTDNTLHLFFFASFYKPATNYSLLMAVIASYAHFIF